jgi:hypothetical protein
VTGCAWLLATGAWPFMWDVLFNWNPEYYEWSGHEMDQRVRMVLGYFAPWSLLQLVSIPAALISLVRARIWRAATEAGPAGGQALLAALYLGWLVEAVFLQKSFHYCQAPVQILAIAVVMSLRWNLAAILIAWSLIGGTLNHYRDSCTTLCDWLDPFEEKLPNTFRQVIPRQKLINTEWRSVWRECVTAGSSPQLKDQLSFYRHIHCAPTWVELDEVRRYLQTLGLKDRELVCWDDSSHPLYLDLGIRPAIRFMHVNTALDFKSKRPQIRRELIASGHKYVVSDLALPHFLYGRFPDDPPPGAPLALPEDFPDFDREIYPWNQPIIFRAGRYSVHRVEKPIEEIRILFPEKDKKP